MVTPVNPVNTGRRGYSIVNAMLSNSRAIEAAIRKVASAASSRTSTLTATAGTTIGRYFSLPVASTRTDNSTDQRQYFAIPVGKLADKAQNYINNAYSQIQTI